MADDSDLSYLRPLVERLGAKEVHRLVDLIVAEQDEDQSVERAAREENPSEE